MSKKKKVLEVAKSTFEIWVDNNSTFVDNAVEAERKYRNATGRETIYCYLYRHDYDIDGNLIESYMLA
jgi:hypothetical protein